jgi:hypothetical protein
MGEVDFVRCDDATCDYKGPHCHPVGERRLGVLRRNAEAARRRYERKRDEAKRARVDYLDAKAEYDDVLALAAKSRAGKDSP